MKVDRRFASIPMPAALWARVDVSGGKNACWPWTGPVNGGGYGAFCRRGWGRSAHQAAYIATYGPLDGRYVLHHCDNRRCCNPRHLFIGTAKDNATDMLRKGRGARREQTRHLGEAHGRAKLTEAAVRDIRRRYSAPRVTYADLAREHGMSASDAFRKLKDEYAQRRRPTLQELANEYGVSPKMVHFVVRGQNWTHI